MKSFFIPREVAKIIGISYRQLQYWDKTRFIRPSYRRRGKYRLYVFSDLALLMFAKLLRESSVSIQRMRKLVQTLRELLPQCNAPLPELTILVDHERILVFSDDLIVGGADSPYVRFDLECLVRRVEALYPESTNVPVVSNMAKAK